jgi:RecA/RadA recombinase
MAKSKLGKIPTKNELQKRYGSSLVLDASQIVNSGLWIPSTFFALNYQLGGGIPYGKILEIMGMYSSGKTLLA